MTDSRLTLVITTPRGEVLREEVAYVVLPSTEGYVGILPRHIPMVNALSPGIVSFRKVQDAPRRRVSVSGGFAEVADNQVNVLADTAETPEEIDVARARDALRRAERRLQNDSDNVDVTRARAALERAIARLKAADEYGDGDD